jgi:hypothetical protein
MSSAHPKAFFNSQYKVVSSLSFIIEENLKRQRDKIIIITLFIRYNSFKKFRI